MNALCDSLEWAPFIAYGLIKNLSPYLTGMETSWRLESPWVAVTSPRCLLEVWRVARESRWNQTCSIFSATLWKLFQVSSWSRRRWGDVAATKYVFKEEDVSETCWRPNDWEKVATTSPQRLRNVVSAIRRPRLRDDDWPTFIYLEGKLSKKLKLIYTYKTWYMMYIDNICTRKFLNIV